MMPVVAQIYSPRSVNASLPHCLFCTFLWCISSHPWENLCKLAALQNVQCAVCNVQCAMCNVQCMWMKVDQTGWLEEGFLGRQFEARVGPTKV